MANDYDMTARNAMLDALGALCTRIALHSGDPGGANSATNELTGGSPAYARKAIAWNAAGSPTPGSMDDSTAPVFDVPAAATVSWISGWNTAGTVRYFKKDVTDEVFGAQGTYTLTDADLDLNTA
jgi:transcription elongation factor